MNRIPKLWVLVLVIALVGAACTDPDPVATGAGTGQDDIVDPTAAPTTPPTVVEEPTAVPDDGETAPDTADPDGSAATDNPDGTDGADGTGLGDVALQPSLNQLSLLGAQPGRSFELISGTADGTVVAEGQADEQGALLWRDLDAGAYVVRATDDGATSAAVDVLPVDALPAADFYSSQEIGPGFGYITTRDGTTLSATVWLPGDEGPFPTVVEYSGYAPSNPGDGTSAQLYNTLGYAYVGVNMRGTGCSGGSFEFFEPVQVTDGYDVIEAIAAQPWVEHNHVGMVGISYPGISQLFVAQSQPPSLAAITPLSVLDDTYTTLYPGGILNTGFAVDWSNERESDARPYGQGWEQGIVDDGDTMCADNQLLRLQNTDAGGLIADTPFFDPAQADLSPMTFVDQIAVPVFLAGAWQDEQTGGHFPALLDRFTSSPAVYATMVNGSHTESLSPAIFERYAQFLDLYVAERTPVAGAGFISTILSGSLTGESVSLPPSTDYEGLDVDEALALFESQPRVRILFEEGAAEDFAAGAPVPRFEAGFDAWPVAGTATPLYFHADGQLRAVAPGGPAEPSVFVSDPDALPGVTFDGGSSDIWAADAVYSWDPIPEGTGLDWVGAPLAETIVVVGSASADLWIQADAADVDLEVTISEVRPDGTEVYVQSGWLRAGHRALNDDESTESRPVHTHLAEDYEELPSDRFVEARVDIFPFAHAFREGSQIRITVDAPGGARPLWAFAETLPGAAISIAQDAVRPSRLVLNVVDGVDVPAEPPACGALRSQPCRQFVALGG